MCILSTVFPIVLECKNSTPKHVYPFYWLPSSPVCYLYLYPEICVSYLLDSLVFLQYLNPETCVSYFMVSLVLICITSTRRYVYPSYRFQLFSSVLSLPGDMCILNSVFSSSPVFYLYPEICIYYHLVSLVLLCNISILSYQLVSLVLLYCLFQETCVFYLLVSLVLLCIISSRRHLYLINLFH